MKKKLSYYTHLGFGNKLNHRLYHWIAYYSMKGNYKYATASSLCMYGV